MSSGSGRWVTMSTVRLPRSLAIALSTRACDAGSSPLVGSSRSSTGCLVAMARASAIHCRSPPETTRPPAPRRSARRAATRCARSDRFERVDRGGGVGRAGATRARCWRRACRRGAARPAGPTRRGGRRGPPGRRRATRRRRGCLRPRRARGRGACEAASSCRRRWARPGRRSRPASMRSENGSPDALAPRARRRPRNSSGAGRTADHDGLAPVPRARARADPALAAPSPASSMTRARSS